ncbi:MAG: NitT/TauT family transport system permease protein, partial [bacterium]
MMAVLGALLIWGAGWWLNIRLANGAHSDNPLVRVLIPAIFGITVILIWEILVAEFDVNPVILPAPSSIGARLLVEGPRLWADFQQTI